MLRLQKNTKVNGKVAKKHRSKRKAKVAERKEIFDLELYFGCKFISKGRADCLYVISNNFTPHQMLEIYKSRWSIEVLFDHLKKKGFNLENTHISDRRKINKLIAVLFTLGWGLIMKKNKTLTVHQKRKTIFRLALDLLNSMMDKPSKHKERIKIFDQ